jgi:glycosyltransferase involved in cell wall biosynthesis
VGTETALVHDYLLVMRGAERTFSAMAEVWSGSPIYTTLYCPHGTEARFADRTVHTSYLQRTRTRQGSFRRLLPLYPSAVERLPVQRYDVIVSSSSAFAHGIRARPDAVHVCYCHSPFRYAWHEREAALREVARPLRPYVGRMLDRIRRWDLEASKRVTHYVANSRFTQERIERYYGLESTIVHPPVATERFRPGHVEDYFLFVGELVRHKRVEVALEAARKAGVKLKLVGTGPDIDRLRAEYAGTGEFLGRVSDEELAAIYTGAQALVVPNAEEFGIAAVEAQAAGRPVIALDRGGTSETVADGVTGVHVDDSVDAFAEAMRHVDFGRFDQAALTRNAERYGKAAFQRRLTEAVSEAVGARS